MNDQPDPPKPVQFGAPRTVAPVQAIEIEVLPLDDGAQRHRTPRAAARLNGIFGVLVVGVITVAAIPAGSNVPVFWALWTGLVCLMLAAHMVLMARFDPGRPVAVTQGRQWVAPVLCLVYLAWVGVQTLPLQLAPALPGGVQSATISVMPQAGWLGLLRQFGYLALFVLSLEVAGRTDRVEVLIRLLFAAICLHALWAMVALRFLDDLFLWGEKTSYIGAATGTFINRNNFAAFLGVGFVLGAAIVADLVNVPRVRKAGSAKGPRMGVVEVLVPVAGMALIFVAILSTQSRMGVFSTILGTALVFAVMRRKQGLGLVRVLAEATVILALLGGPILALSGTAVVERLLDIGDERNGRLILWQQVWTMLADRPLAGFGLDSFYPAFELYHRPPLSTSVVWEYAHNSYLSLWVEAGCCLARCRSWPGRLWWRRPHGAPLSVPRIMPCRRPVLGWG